MFQSLGDRLNQVFQKLRGRGVLSEQDVLEACREVRLALLEADVALPVVKDFIETVKTKAVGQEVLKSITPGQMVVKIVHDEIEKLLTGEGQEINLAGATPIVILMVGLQGAGKTTASAKIALHLKDKRRKKVLMASLDVYRPAAQEQLSVLGSQIEVETLPIVPGEEPLAIAGRALELGRRKGFDVVILDTAGRLHVDEALMEEAASIQKFAKPLETFLVVDAMTGQDAVVTGKAFHERLPLTGVVLTRLDGDTRGGAALSMRAVTGCPIKFASVGEKIDQLEPWRPDRIASRILGMGDVVTLVEQAMDARDEAEDARLERRMAKGIFDLSDLATQLNKMKKMGGMAKMMSLLPGMGGMADKLKDKVDDKALNRQIAMIQSMTPKERKNPVLLGASRKRRVAAGAGVEVADVNRLLKQYEGMAKMLKKVKKMGAKGMMRGGLSSLLGGPQRPR